MLKKTNGFIVHDFQYECENRNNWHRGCLEECLEIIAPYAIEEGFDIQEIRRKALDFEYTIGESFSIIYSPDDLYSEVDALGEEA